MVWRDAGGGRSGGADASKPEGRGLLAERAARVDAVRNLLEQVQGLEIKAKTTVRDFVADHDEILTQLRGVLSGAVADDPQWEGDTVHVRVSIPAVDVWSAINEELRICRRQGK